jgi:hypothetical protein
MAVIACRRPAETTLRSMTFVKAALPTERLIVLTHIARDMTFPPDMHWGFEVGMAKALTSCHVIAEITSLENTDLEDFEWEVRLTNKLRSKTVLFVRSTGGEAMRFNNGYLIGDKLLFDLTLFDADSNTKRWAARARLDATVHTTFHKEDQISGARFAASIVAQLRDDGILPGCPPGALTPASIGPSPACLEARRLALHEAAQIENQRERMSAKVAAPVCE